jgi:hypothetical protein
VRRLPPSVVSGGLLRELLPHTGLTIRSHSAAKHRARLVVRVESPCSDR